MNPPDPKTELLELCDRLLDGEFGLEHRARLEALVLGDAGLRRLYVETMHLHAALRLNSNRVGDIPLADVIGALDDEPANVVGFPRWPLQIAAAISIGFAAWWFTPRPVEKPLATLVETNGARWENSSLPTAPGSALRAGRLRLSDGVARIVFQSGAKVSLEGTAELELTGPNACFLHSGALTAHVPEQARGFVVGTANARLVDHGTDFGISTDVAGHAQVQVLKGEVELQHGRTGAKLTLQTRESAAVTPDKFAQAKEKTDSEPDRYAFVRPNESRQKPVLTLTTAGGAGDAAYVASPGSRIHHSDTLLLIKNAPTLAYLRKAILRFDLGPLHERQVVDASLTLNFEASGFGYASLTGECVFAVYGVSDDAQDDWSPETLTWENAPAFTAEAGRVDTTRALKLGTFIMPRGVVSGAFSLESPALADFLNHDANRRATLVVVRETIEPGNNAAVHGFAGNHHPTLAPPTLRLTLAK